MAGCPVCSNSKVYCKTCIERSFLQVEQQRIVHEKRIEAIEAALRNVKTGFDSLVNRVLQLEEAVKILTGKTSMGPRIAEAPTLVAPGDIQDGPITADDIDGPLPFLSNEVDA